MRNIEKSIIRKIFLFETKKTVAGTMARLLLLSVLIFLAYSVISSVIFQLQTQGTLDLLQIVGEDSEIFRTYVAEVIDTIVEEVPKFEATMLILTFTGLVLFLTFVVKHLPELRNKWKSLYHFWFRKV